MARKKKSAKKEKKPPLGSGERFEKLTKQLAAKGAKNPKALAAWKKYGKKRFQELAAKGRKRKAKKK